MLLGHKKTQGDEKNWSIILNPLRNELDKKRVARKISEAFLLSPDEASDLVSNTPIILLDNLTRNDAVRVKHYFQSTGAEIMLTNDIFLKRKCYRTVWPDPPSLSFLEGWQAAKQEREEMPAEELAVEEALQEIQSLAPNPAAAAGKAPVREEKESFPSLPQDERDRLMREADRWKREGISYQAEAARLRQEIDSLRRESDRVQKERTAMGRPPTSHDDGARPREKEIHDLQTLLNNAEEKYEGLKEEYRQVRILMDEKLAQAGRRAEEEIAKNTEIRRKMESSEKLRQELAEAVGRAEEKTVSAKEEYRRSQALMADKLSQAVKQIEQLSLRNSETAEKIDILDRTRKELEQELGPQRDKYRALETEYRDVHGLMERKLSDLTLELASWKQKADELEKKARSFEAGRQILEQEMKSQSEQANLWRDNYQTLVRETEALKTAFQEEISQRSKIEERFGDLEKSFSRLNQDLDERSREARQWELRTLDLEKGLSEARHACEEHERVLEGKNKIIEGKDREHESMRRQLREINQQMEQRGAVQKRMQLMGQLAEKEAQLKKLVGDQEKIEVEIRSREEGMRAILAEQEVLEKEIIKAKQTERHLMEQIKKEKSPRFSAGGGPASGEKTVNGKNDAAVFQPAGDGETAD